MKTLEGIFLPWCLFFCILGLPAVGPVLAVNAVLIAIEQYYFHRKRMKTVDYIIEHELPKSFPYTSKEQKKHFLFWVNTWVFEKYKKNSVEYRLEMLKKYQDDICEKYPILTHNQFMGQTRVFYGLG